MNHWATNGEKQDEERYGQFWEFSGQGKQRCFELFVVCIRDTENSQTGANYSSQDLKEQRQKQQFLWHLWMMHGTNVPEFRTG